MIPPIDFTFAEDKKRILRWIFKSLAFGIVWGIYKGGVIPGLIGAVGYFAISVIVDVWCEHFRYG